AADVTARRKGEEAVERAPSPCIGRRDGTWELRREAGREIGADDQTDQREPVEPVAPDGPGLRSEPVRKTREVAHRIRRRRPRADPGRPARRPPPVRVGAGPGGTAGGVRVPNGRGRPGRPGGRSRSRSTRSGCAIAYPSPCFVP